MLEYYLTYGKHSIKVLFLSMDFLFWKVPHVQNACKLDMDLFLKLKF